MTSEELMHARRVYTDELESVQGDETQLKIDPNEKRTNQYDKVLRKLARGFQEDEEEQEEEEERKKHSCLGPLKLKVVMESEQRSFNSVHKDWGMIKLEALPQKVAQLSIGMDFIVVIDHSSSMRMDQKLAFVKATIQYMVSHLGEKHRFCLIEFNHEVNVVTKGLLQMTQDKKQILLECLKAIKPEGSTNISDALFKAVDILKERNEDESQRLSSIMLFTDGLANAGLRGTKFIQEITKMIIPQGLTISTFGYGVDHDSKMLQNISFCSMGGVYYYIETIDSISASFGECLAGLLSTVAHNIRVKITAEDGCRIVSFYTRFPIEEHKAVKDYSVSLGSIFSQEERSILFKVSLRKFSATAVCHPLFKVHLMYTNTLTGEKEELVTPVAIGRPTRSSTDPMPAELDKNINRYTAAVAMEEAAQKANSKDFQAAQKHIYEVVSLIKKSISASDSAYAGYCEDLVHDLNECATGLSGTQAFSSGIHYIHAYSTMYFIERSTGTANLQGISHTIAESTLPEKRRNCGYGYRSSEQERTASLAVNEAKHYVTGYLDPY